jgi:hypothetical protein
VDYLTIPGEIESEELHSYQLDQKTVVVTMAVGDTSTYLFRASVEGRNIELVVIMGTVTLALDNVYVSSFSVPSASGGEPPVATIGLDAAEIRYMQ